MPDKSSIQTPFWIGGLASAMSASLLHPLDLVKVRLQSDKTSNRPSMIATFKQVYKEQGISKGLYRGLSASLLRQMTYSTTRFAVYERLKRRVLASRPPPEAGKHQSMGFLLNASCAILAGAMGGLAGTPADLVNVRMQADGRLPVEERRGYRNAIDGLVRIVKDEGPLALTTGWFPCMTRAAIMTFTQLGVYDTFKGRLLQTRHFDDNIFADIVASLGAGLIATTLQSPVDVAKTRIMTTEGPKFGLLPTIWNIAKTEGPMALFKGWMTAYTRLGPHTILIAVFYEELKRTYIRLHS
jgi:dicarboxylate transporter 10